MTDPLPDEIQEQMQRARLPSTGSEPFRPKIKKNRKGRFEIDKQAAAKGPKKGKKGYVDQDGRIWIRDHAHAGLPMHWDVQLDGGDDYFRVDTDGNILD
jgi:hypothetical protein